MFAALVPVTHRYGPVELTMREIAAEAGLTAGALVRRVQIQTRDAAGACPLRRPDRRSRRRRAHAAERVAAGRDPGDQGALSAQLPDCAARRAAQSGVCPERPGRSRFSSSPRSQECHRAARAHYKRLVTNATAAGGAPRPDTNAAVPWRAPSRIGPWADRVAGWTLYREGAAPAWLREEPGGPRSAVLKPG